MSEPHWKQELYATLKGELDERLRTHTELAREFLADALGVAVLPHIEAAYQRGLMAGRSQQGYDTRRKPRKEKPKWYHLQQMETDTAGAAGSTPALNTEPPPTTARDAGGPAASAPHGE